MVLGMWGGDIDHINLRVGQQIGIAAVMAGRAKLARKRRRLGRIARCHTVQQRIIELCQCLGELTGNPTGAENAPAHTTLHS
jgi:hypothetical protein